MKYGLYIPLACVVLFSLWDLFTGGHDGMIDQLLTNALVIGLGCHLALGVSDWSRPGYDTKQKLFTGKRRIRLLPGASVPRVPDRTTVPGLLAQRISLNLTKRAPCKKMKEVLNLRKTA